LFIAHSPAEIVCEIDDLTTRAHECYDPVTILNSDMSGKYEAFALAFHTPFGGYWFDQRSKPFEYFARM